jgi:hypothetical protein
VLYFGDFDPSGEAMDRHLVEALSYFDLDSSTVHFERIAVTQDQIDEYNLPPTPEDSETLDKLDKDSRTNGFIDKYGKLIAVELDALLAIAPPDEFKELVQGSVDQYFDECTYRRERKRYSPEGIRRLVHQRLGSLMMTTRRVRTKQ